MVTAAAFYAALGIRMFWMKCNIFFNFNCTFLVLYYYADKIKLYIILINNKIGHPTDVRERILQLNIFNFQGELPGNGVLSLAGRVFAFWTFSPSPVPCVFGRFPPPPFSNLHFPGLHGPRNRPGTGKNANILSYILFLTDKQNTSASTEKDSIKILIVCFACLFMSALNQVFVEWLVIYAIATFSDDWITTVFYINYMAYLLGLCTEEICLALLVRDFRKNVREQVASLLPCNCGPFNQVLFASGATNVNTSQMYNQSGTVLRVKANTLVPTAN
jgi:hypothetical protein